MLLFVTVSSVTGATNIEKTDSMYLGPHSTSTIRAWSDNFDEYELGQFLDGDPEDGGWEGWDEDPAFGAYVVDDEYLSEPHSVDIVGDTDLVHEFEGYTSGEWRFLAWQYVPTDFSGQSYFILLSDYAEVDPGTNSKWAVQIKFDSSGIVESEFDGVTLPLITGQWVLLRTEINLDTDWFEFYYNGDLLIEKEWTAGPNNAGDGYLVVDAVDLFANGATSVYYDDLSLDIPQPLSCDADGPYEGEAEKDIQFQGSATGGVPFYTYYWEFGDGGTSDKQNPTHAYDEAGEYTVTLTVTDYIQNTAEDETTATVAPKGPQLEIGTINGGLFKVSAGIKNNGEVDATDVNWSITLKGGAFIGKETTGEDL
ncbi:MAG: PKD domain-containing protein, partial [Petrotogales bacterium]